MKGFTPLIFGIFATLAFSWMGLAFIPNLQIGHLDPQTDEEGKDAYPAPKSGMADRGRRVYVANGCFYCHSQQVRADYAGSDIERKWGERRSAPRDYIFERPVELGKMRMGPDLANIGHRAPAEDQNVPAQPSPGPSGGASPPNASPAPAGSTSSANQAAKPQESPAAAPAAPSSPAATARSPVASQDAKAPAAVSQSPATTATATTAPAATTITSTNAAATGVSPPTVQQPGPAVAGAATTLDSFPSESPPPYSAAWHHQHLYSPRSLNVDSNMPAYKFLYIKRPVSGQPSARALRLRREDAPRQGWEIVPSYDADCLVAYLMSLDQSHPLKEVKSAAASPSPSPSAPGKTPR